MSTYNYYKLPDPILEKTTPTLTATITDASNQVVPGANLLTLTLTLFNLSDYPTCTIINTRSDQNVLNTNNVTIDGSGNLVWTLREEDTKIVSDLEIEENHRAVFKWTYNSGPGVITGRHIIDMIIKNIQKI